MQRLSQYLSYVKDSRASLFLGAGISALAGCSGLKDIQNKLKEIDSIKEALKSQNSDEVSAREMIAFCKSKLKSDDDRHAFEGTMRQGLTPDPEKFSKEYVPFLNKIRLISPLPPIMTTNVDYCLTNTKVFKMDRIFYELSDMTIANFQRGGIFHLHGYREEKNNEVWDIFDYEKRYVQEFKDFLVEIFKNYSVLYLGYALDDQELLQQMANAKKGNSKPINHFVLLPEDYFPTHVQEPIYEELYNLHIIRYGLRNDFINLFGKWIESNFSSLTIGRPDQVSSMPQEGGRD